MAQSLTAESNPRRQGSFKNKTSEQSSPIYPPKEHNKMKTITIYFTEETVDRKGGQIARPIGRPLESMNKGYWCFKGAYIFIQACRQEC